LAGLVIFESCFEQLVNFQKVPKHIVIKSQNEQIKIGANTKPMKIVAIVKLKKHIRKVTTTNQNNKSIEKYYCFLVSQV
jgi:hypothetical protein